MYGKNERTTIEFYSAILVSTLYHLPISNIHNMIVQPCTRTHINNEITNKQKLQTIGKIVEYSEGRGWAEDINEDGSLKIKSIDGDYINLTSPLISEVN